MLLNFYNLYKRTFENPINYGLKNSNNPLLSTSNFSIQEQNYQSKYNQNHYLALDYSSLNLNSKILYKYFFHQIDHESGENEIMRN